MGFSIYVANYISMITAGHAIVAAENLDRVGVVLKEHIRSLYPRFKKEDDPDFFRYWGDTYDTGFKSETEGVIFCQEDRRKLKGFDLPKTVEDKGR